METRKKSADDPERTVAWEPRKEIDRGPNTAGRPTKIKSTNGPLDLVIRW